MTDETKDPYAWMKPYNKRCPTDGMTDAEKNAFIMGFEMCEESLNWGVNHPNRMPDHGCTLPPAIVEHREEVRKVNEYYRSICLLSDENRPDWL